jgi:CrcB protein
MTIVVMAIAGSMGAMTRYLVSGAVQERTASSLPLGTAVVNLVGALVLGVALGANGDSMWWKSVVGFAGGFTTFSTWAVETVGLGVTPRPTLGAVMNLVILTVGGVAMAAAGFLLATIGGNQ